MVLQSWGLQTLATAFGPSTPAPWFGLLEGHVTRLHSECKTILNMLKHPVPFPYYHSLVLLMVINYGMFSFSFLQVTPT